MSDLIVKAWQEKIIIPTYDVGKPDKNPMFFEKRVYQGSSGVVYPNPVIEKIFDEKKNKEYNALFLENKYIKVMILPELGGRIQMAYDKIKQRHFVYYNQVIKPALVGLTGPWISGGIEFNWPQHHRPSTFEPIDFRIEEKTDGSKTVWVNEIEKMFHTKGMAGFTLYPDKAYIEISAKIYNGSELPQTFLWWANPAVKVNDHYQSVFPPDVNAVFDHGKRDVSSFPIATGTYYKVDYSPGTDISRYKNIPVPTSYMAINSDYDFVGGYEHDTKGGLLHVANHHVSPGKKQWTWGYSDFGIAWDRNLTDEDGPYIELMTGVFTDNQPDFTWLMPHEEKSFKQYFMPYHELGMIKNANKDIMLSVEVIENGILLKVHVTSIHKDLQIDLSYDKKLLLNINIDLSPEHFFEEIVDFDGVYDEKYLLIVIKSAKGDLLRYEPAQNKQNELPQAAKPALMPAEIESNEQLFLTGQHLEQYRHATYSPVPYYQEALLRDANDIRSNNALGLWFLRRGNFLKAEPYFRKAVHTSLSRNPNPYDSEPHFNLGLCLRFLGRVDESYPFFYKATWSNAWKAIGYFSVAEIDMIRGDYQQAIDHVSIAINNNSNDNKAYILKSAALRSLGLYDQAAEIGREALHRDSFNLGILFELRYVALAQLHLADADQYLRMLVKLSRGEVHNFLEYAYNYRAIGMYEAAYELLEIGLDNAAMVHPMLYYSLAFYAHKMEKKDTAIKWLQRAANADPYLCFPNRLVEIEILEYALQANPNDAFPAYYLGNLFYDKRQYEKAIKLWERAASINNKFATIFRNLGLAYFNKNNDQAKALECYEKAFSIDQSDARVLMELDQLYKRLNYSPKKRLAFLEQHLSIVSERDDLYLERICLYNLLGKNETAFQLIMSRQFHPWEGGEGKVTEQYVYSLLNLAIKNCADGKFAEAVTQLELAQHYPSNLGEGKLFGTQENDIFYWLGCAHEGLGNEQDARKYFEMASVGLEDPKAAVFYNDQKPDKMLYQGLALQKLGQVEKADVLFRKLIVYGKQHIDDVVKIDYFAVSLPDLLIFDDDLDLRNRLHNIYLQALGHFGLKDQEMANELFKQVIEMNAAHLGSHFHKNQLQLQD